MLQQAKREAEAAREREAALTRAEIRPLSSRTLKRLVRVATDVNVKPHGGVQHAAATPPSVRGSS